MSANARAVEMYVSRCFSAVRHEARGCRAYALTLSTTLATSASMSSALSLGKGRASVRLTSGSPCVVPPSRTVTSKQPFLGFSAFTSTWTAGRASPKSFFSLSARVLNAPQDLHASMWTSIEPAALLGGGGVALAFAFFEMPFVAGAFAAVAFDAAAFFAIVTRTFEHDVSCSWAKG